jgi:nitroreductase
MELAAAIRRRRMVKEYESTSMDIEQIRELVELALRAPSGGWTQATEFLVLSNAARISRFWTVCVPSEQRSTMDDRWPTWRKAPVVVLPLTSSERYLERYRKGDKANTPLGRDESEWPVPYWDIDCGMAVQNLLLAVTDAGLGAAFFGLFGEPQTFLVECGVPPEYHAIGAVTIGHRPLVSTEPTPPSEMRRPAGSAFHVDGW